MLSIEKCYEILNKDARNYTKDQSEDIRNFLYEFTEILMEQNPINNEKEPSK